MNLFKQIDIWMLLGGVGLFLFAMHILEDSIKQLAGRSFKRLIRKHTKGKFRSIVTGTLVTAILQSSSAVSLLVITFAGAGIMAMENAIGVIVGANIGTTVTAWIVATVGFKLSFEVLSLPIVAIGGLILIFLGKSRQYANLALLFVSFGLVFMGLGLMRESFIGIAEQVDASQLAEYGTGSFLLAGLVLTAITQSSSATLALILTGIDSGIIDFEHAAFMVIGANLGTTSTVLIGGLRANQIKKRVATSHFLFNLLATVSGLIFLRPILYLIELLFGFSQENVVLEIACFHTIFNVSGAMIFLPFIGHVARFLTWLFPEKMAASTQHIHRLSPSVYDAAIEGIKLELSELNEQVMLFNLQLFKVEKMKEERFRFMSTESDLVKQYDQLKLTQSEIFRFASEMQEYNLNEDERLELFRLLHAARELINSAKAIKDISHNLSDFEAEDNPFLQELLENLKNRMKTAYKQIKESYATSNHARIAEQIARVMSELKEEDSIFLVETGKAVRTGTISDLTISNTLLVNRSYIYSTKLLLNALSEQKLNREESDILDHVLQ